MVELFFHHKGSPFVRKVLLAVEELGAAVAERTVDITSSAAMDEYAAINPNRRFPALRDGDLVLWESNAILRYLARRHDPAWLGTTPEQTLLVDQWLFWELAHLGPALLGLQNLRLGFLPPPPRDEAALVQEQKRALAVLDSALARGAHIAGSAITVADLAVASDFCYVEEARLLDASYKNVRRWLDAMRRRPSWRATERMKRDALAAAGVRLPEATA